MPDSSAQYFIRSIQMEVRNYQSPLPLQKRETRGGGGDSFSNILCILTINNMELNEYKTNQQELEKTLFNFKSI